MVSPTSTIIRAKCGSLIGAKVDEKNQKVFTNDSDILLVLFESLLRLDSIKIRSDLIFSKFSSTYICTGGLKLLFRQPDFVTALEAQHLTQGVNYQGSFDLNLEQLH